MSNHRHTYQQVYNVSIPKEELLEAIVYNDNLNKRDLRICLMLLTELEGYPLHKSMNGDGQDPNNYKKIDAERIAKKLNMDVKDVKKSLKKLLKEEILEKGNTNNMKNGYRFTF